MINKLKINRAMKRKLRKDKNLIKELYKIIMKYLPELITRFGNLSDSRVQNYVTYKMKVICITRLFGLICGLTTITGISEKFNTDETIKNIGQICNENLSELPYWETIQDVFENLNIEELREIQKYIVVALLRSKMFDKYRYNKQFILAVDGTGLQHFKENYTKKCIQKKHKKTDQIEYYTYVLEAKLILGNIVISLDSEFVENNKITTDKEKQDCEINAFKRMAVRIKKQYPKYKFIIVGDALYATSPTIQICKDNNWNYVFNLKKDRLKNVYYDFECNIDRENKTKLKNYFLSLNQKYKTHIFNVLKYKDLYATFHYITNLEINDDNIEQIVRIGRMRWKIENEGFNVQKNGTFEITHACSRNDNALKAHYFFIQFAHTIRQLLEKGSLVVREMKLKIKEVSPILYTTLTSNVTPLNNIELTMQLRFDT